MNNSVKIKENEKRDVYLYLASELKFLLYMKETLILIAICAPGTILKGLVSGCKK